jgi:predicted nuclease of predicted toxin-antitoxin system
VRLLLDEMIAPRIARELRDAGHDVQAIKRDRPDLIGRGDRELVRQMAAERRVIVTNDIADFQAIHDRLLAAGDAHHGMIFTFDATMPRSRGAIAQWVRTLSALLSEHRDDDWLRNRIRHLA